MKKFSDVIGNYLIFLEDTMSKEKNWADVKVGVRRSTHKRLKKHLKNYGDTMDLVIVKLLDAYEKSGGDTG